MDEPALVVRRPVFRWERILLIGCTVVLLSAAVKAQSFSMSTNFDGGLSSGTASFSRFQSSNRPSQPSSPSRPDRSSPPISSDRPSIIDSGYEIYVAFEENLRKEQAERAARQAELLKKLESEKRERLTHEALDTLRRINEIDGIDDDEDRRDKLTLDVLHKLVPEFHESQEQNNEQLRRLSSQMAQIRVPSPSVPPNYKRLMIFGATVTPAEAQRQRRLGLSNPFDGQRFDQVLGFAVPGLAEVGRVVGDHFLSEINLLTPTTKNQLAPLRGAVVDDLVCHSNGCAVTYVLIATGYIKVRGSVRMLGGDASISNLDQWQELQQKTGLKIAAYATEGDPVPLAPTGWQIMDAMRRIGSPLRTFAASLSLTDQVLGLTSNPGYQPAASIQVQILTPLVRDEPALRRHEFIQYDGLITAQRMMGALLSNGDFKPGFIVRNRSRAPGNE